MNQTTFTTTQARMLIECLRAFDNHLNTRFPSQTGTVASYANEVAYGTGGPLDWWSVSHDSDPTDAGYVERLLVFDINDDGYFVTMIARYENWGDDDYDDYRLAALAYKGSDNPNWVVIGRRHWPSDD